MLPRRFQSQVTFWLTFLIMRAGEATIGAMFWQKLPHTQIVLWIAVIWLLGSPQFIIPYAKIYQTAKHLQRRIILRFIFLPHAVWAGSCAYFLYVPGDITYQALLNISIICMAAMAALSTVQDFLRTASSIALIIGPATARYFYENTYTTTLFGIGGLLIMSALILLARESHRTLQAQRKLRDQAERAVETVAAVNLNKARFFAAVSHDLRQPVHAIGLFTEPLTALKLQPAETQAVQGIRQSWQALDGLLSQVLDLTKLDAGAIEPKLDAVELAPLIRSLILQYSATADKKNIRLIALVAEGRFGFVDHLMLQRVLSNLLSNAIKFSPNNGRVVITVRRTMLSEMPAWCVQVRDGGPGIAVDEQEKIFEEFVQLDNAARQREHGIGLGLAIAKRFCMLMGCELHLRSRLGQGATMSVNVPRCNAPINSLQQTISYESTWVEDDLSADGFGQKVLLLEDDPLIAGSMSLLLRNWGYEVQHTTCAQEAINWASAAHIVLCDVRLPGEISGLEVARILKQRGYQVAVMTGETDPQAKAQAKSYAVEMLIKPVAPYRLHKTLATMRSAIQSKVYL